MACTLRRMICLIAVLIVAVSSASPAAEWGDLTGRFLFDGPPPEQKPVDTSKDKACCGAFNVLDESLVVAKDGGIANVVIYVRSKIDNQAIHPMHAVNAPPTVVCDNKQCRFEPHMQCLWYPKTQLVIHNSDNCSHNSALSPLLDKAINPLIPANAEVTYRFSREQNIPQRVICNIHPWMGAYILPRSNPYFAVSAADGSFTIKDLPAGEHEFQVWHEAVGFLSTPGWKLGRFKQSIKPGANRLSSGKDGAVLIAPASLKRE